VLIAEEVRRKREREHVLVFIENNELERMESAQHFAKRPRWIRRFGE